ncbi:hypothetical protein ACM64Y_10980 [Novispirillum sp. DQ9]|uniref:hypothetical protein n=1 Tax=Novispirillum sp. DQ9 TaxID=3398612 RepID=UPI003C7DF17D
MPPTWTMDLMGWITAVELPVLGGLFWMIWRARAEADAEIEANRRTFELGLAQQREALAAYKLEVAKGYASIGYIKDVEKRLTVHLERIEHKLDVKAAPAAGGRA